jgi:serpin B
MTQAGAKGGTAEQMAKALHFTLPQTELHPAFAALAAQTRAAGSAGHVQLSVANSLWPHNTHPFLADYLSLAKRDYDVDITAVDYEHAEPAARNRINQWVENRTQRKITNLIASPLSPLTRMVLVNAVYFKGDWESPFHVAQTQEAPFHRPSGNPVSVPFMEKTHRFRYGEWPTFQAVELPYAGNALSMLVILPSTAEGVSQLESTLSADRLNQWSRRLTPREVQLFLPKFRITWGAQSLNQGLQALGMRDAFAPEKADFSGMDGQPRGLYISDVFHKAYVDVNEEGTEAAAATGVIMATRAMIIPEPPPIFRADRPFLFLIRENRTGTVLFMGRVTDPSVK